jgi:hypothetical protein
LLFSNKKSLKELNKIPYVEFQIFWYAICSQYSKITIFKTLKPPVFAVKRRAFL